MPGLRIPTPGRRPGVIVEMQSLWPLALTVLLVLTQLFYPARVWIVLLWLTGGLTGAAYLWARQLARRVDVRRELRYGWMQVGDRLEERFTLDNEGWLPVIWAEVDDASDLPGYRIDRVASCPARSRIAWAVAQECSRRGLFRLGPWALRTGDPFGLFSVTLHHPEAQTILVYPPVVELPYIPLPGGRMAGSSQAHRHAPAAAAHVSHTRRYQPGDPLRAIHWPSTAHRGALIAREPDTEVAGDIWIVLDMERGVHVGAGEESTEEYGVILAASLADRALRQNRAVGLVADGAELAYVPPGREQGQIWRIQRALAVARAAGTRPLATVLSNLRSSLGRDASVLVITPAPDTAWVEALLPLAGAGRMPTILLLDGASFAPAPEIGAVRDLLARAGFAPHVIHRGHPFRARIRRGTRGRWVFKTSPLGRAVLVRRPEEG